ncbi:predicted protein [Aspergillus nidulans FGSC A4]|uniref:Transcription factor domain-containing protein n=1 Tax=Emericella nidulans (strain FGSC A4 / ATCC 38163 / CBS 112.46 / NRRL 194 / M139) TaxID=227321 RepID=Q5AT72_EMENI|nr:hypothetical protein [Aspergillus nidulans FGSC A4]EAA66852.1 predicted protein [Aspergillus nidulans FGSC A4]CBF80701.1 TPA: conserved hypothetical protein [Aspergillus nidulans FGSC A4]|eukprot:XP_681777.1 predicted protein [Aspergillus nidulans FGSC A4]
METYGAGPPSLQAGAGNCGRGLNYYDSQPGLDTSSGTSAKADAGMMTPAGSHGGLASEAESSGGLLPPQPLLLCNTREKTKCFRPGIGYTTRICDQSKHQNPARGGGAWPAMQYSAVLQLAFDLDSLCRELRQVLEAERPALTVLVEMQLRHAMLALLQPFVLPARTDAQFYLARQMCLQCAMALVTYAHESQSPASVGAEPSLAGPSLLLLQMQMTARGYLRGAFHPAVICALAIEIIVQLSGEAGAATSGRPPYSLDSMARAQRAPIIKTLERLNSQLREMMNQAFPALKRYQLHLGSDSCLEDRNAS